jgi:hypothetical protein
MVFFTNILQRENIGDGIGIIPDISTDEFGYSF